MIFKLSYKSGKMYYYDLYMSVGNACRPAYHLALNDLRNEAYPLDWQMEYSLDTVIHLFKTKFSDFFVDIEEEAVEFEAACRPVKDVKNNIISIHHFPRNIELEKAQEEFVKRMKKRFERLDGELGGAKRVALICNRTDSLEELQAFLKKFWVLYPHLEIKLINIRNDEGGEGSSYIAKEYEINDSLSIEEYIFNDTVNNITGETADWRGNIGIWRDILKNYCNKYKQHNIEIIQNVKKENKTFVIYGAGNRCFVLLNKFFNYNIKIKGIAVTDTSNNPKLIGKYEVNVIEKYDKDDTIIISLEDRKEAELIKKTILEKDIIKYIS